MKPGRILDLFWKNLEAGVDSAGIEGFAEGVGQVVQA
jgi:hypothetical protein